jgi:hypothetical protein
MEIREDDFILTPSINDASPFWDLKLLVTIKAKDKEARKEYKIVAYGIPIESAIRHIANYRVLHNNGNKDITLKEYLDQYTEQIDKIEKLCKAQKKSVDKN